MIKKTIMASLLSASVFISGCGVDNDACVVQVGLDLDSERFDAVITALEDNQTCGGAFSSEEAWMNLGAAYIGTAGISIGKIVGSVGSLAADASGGSADISTLLSTFEEASTTTGLKALSKAQTVYGYLLEGVSCDAPTTAIQEASCMYNQLADTLKMVGVMNASLGGFVDVLADLTNSDIIDVNENNKSDELEVTVCSISGVPQNTGTCAGILIDNSLGNVTFADEDGYSGIYQPTIYSVQDTNASDGVTHGDYNRTLEVNALLTTPAVTVGQCKKDFTPCDAVDHSSVNGCFECPVVADGESISVTSGILDLVNAEDSAIPEGVVSSFDADGDGNITDQELADAIAEFEG